MKELFTGTGVALVTPFHKSGAIDFTALGRIIEHVIEGMVDYLVVMGTTAETPTLSNDEKTAILEFVLETVNKRVPVVLGLGGNNTQEIVNRIKNLNFDGISGILSVCPYYNKPQQKGIFYHYKTISTICPVPIILYNVPGRTGVNIHPDTVIQLAEECDNVVAIKEASGNMIQIMEIVRRKPKDFTVISGDDALTYPMLTFGVKGVISVIANAYPSQFAAMVRLALEGKFDEAVRLHYSLLPIMLKIFEDGSPSGIKAVLNIMGLAENSLRLPLVKVNKSLYLQLQQLVQEYSTQHSF